MTKGISTKRRKLVFAIAAGPSLVYGTRAMATTYTWADPATGGEFRNAANWNPNSGIPSTASDSANLNDSTADRIITYTDTASSAVGSISITQANNVLNELDVRQTYKSVLTLSSAVTLAASGTGTSEIFLDPVAQTTASSGAAALTVPSIAINNGGVLEMSSYDLTATAGGSIQQLSTVNGNITMAGGTLYSDRALGAAAGNSDVNTINGTLTMSSGTISIGQHLAPTGSNAANTGGVQSTADRLSIQNSFIATGGTVSGLSTDVFFLNGQTNSIQLTGNSPILPSVNLGALVTSNLIQTLRSDSPLPGNVQFRQTSGTANQVDTVQFGAVTSGNTLSCGPMTFQAKGTGDIQTIQLVSNVNTSGVPNQSSNSAVTDYLDVNGHTLDTTSAGVNSIFSHISGGTGTDYLINSGGVSAPGTILASSFNLSGTGAGAFVGSYVNLQATVPGKTSTLSASSGGASSTIDPTSTFTYAPTTTGTTGTLISNRNVGNLAVQSGTLTAGSALTTGTGSTVTVASGSTLAMSTFALSTSNLNVAGTLSGGGAVTVSGTLSGTGTFGTTSGVTSSGTLSPASTGTVGTLTVGTGSGALTLASSDTAVYDIASASSYDQVNLNTSPISYGGALSLNFAYTPTVPTTYLLFAGENSYSNTFNSITSNLDSSEALSFNYAAGTLTVTPSSVPEPATLGLVGAAGLLMLRRRRA